MTGEQLFRVWAPDESAWTAWAKPVLFAHAGGAGEPSAIAVGLDDAVAAALPRADGRTAVVVDLPGPAAVAAGVALAAGGYRPVPLFNAVPPHPGPGEPAAAAGRPLAVVDVRPTLGALRGMAAALSASNLPPDAPPAFLLDAARRTGTPGLRPEPELFDNRSVSLPTDFPSGHLLRSKGIDRAVLVQAAAGQPLVDLRHTLVRWQRAGLVIEVQPVDPPGPPHPIRVAVPGGFGRVWQRALAVLGLRRHPLGGFGGMLPEPGGGGG